MKLSFFLNRNTVIKVPISKSQAINRILNGEIDLNFFYFDKRIDGDIITLIPHGKSGIVIGRNSFVPMTTISFTEGIRETEIHICSYLRKFVTVFMYIWLFIFLLGIFVGIKDSTSLPLMPVLGMVAVIFIVFYLSYVFSAKRIKTNIINVLENS